MVAGIEAVIAANRRERFDVVNISLAVPSSDPQLEAAVARLVALDLVVVAASGNKEEGDASSEDGFKGTPGNDADVYPADYPGVLAVSATPPDGSDPSQYVKPNLDTDVAAPTLGRDLGQRDRPGVRRPAGRHVVGRRRGERDPGPAARALPARDPAPAGRPAARPRPRAAAYRRRPRRATTRPRANPWTGAGVVQAHDALTRQLKPGRQGKVETTVRETRADAQAPPAPRAGRPVQHPARDPAVVGPGRRVAARARLHAASAAATLSPVAPRMMESHP